MRRILLASAAVGVVFGGTVLTSPEAQAGGYPVFDAIVDAAIEALQKALDSAINAVGDKVTGLDNDLSNILKDGFTQEANYSKAQIGAQEQITDASNMAMARLNRDFRNREIVDEHTPNPEQCAGVTNGQSIVVSGQQSWKVSTAIEQVSDPRGEAYPGQPAFYGSAQAVQAIGNLHLSRYCSQPEQDAGLCTVSANPNADQRASSLFGTGTYDGVDGVTAANDYITNLISPLSPQRYAVTSSRP